MAISIVLVIDMSPLQLEERLLMLEAEVNRLKDAVFVAENQTQPWWEKIVGIFADDPAFEEAIAMGQKYRQSSQDLFAMDEQE